jgi:hypothetical protein
MIDFKGVQVLAKFVSICKIDYLDDTKVNYLIQDVEKNELFSSIKSLSCHICGIRDFESLAEFKAHRQSNEHLSKLSANVEDFHSNSVDQKEEEETQKTGSPYFSVSHNSHFLTLFKIIVANKKEAIYDQLTLNLDHDLFARLEGLAKANVLIALNGGGYFAAALFSLSEQKLLASKTFKRYTSRRKQGGSQSSKDNASSGTIYSAGAIIRRENEKKLREEIAGLFEKWESNMNPVMMFCNRDIYLLEALSKYGNVKTLPFTTYQASFDEVCRCFSELFTIKYAR